MRCSDRTAGDTSFRKSNWYINKINRMALSMLKSHELSGIVGNRPDSFRIVRIRRESFGFVRNRRETSRNVPAGLTAAAENSFKTTCWREPRRSRRVFPYCCQSTVPAAAAVQPFQAAIQRASRSRPAAFMCSPHLVRRHSTSSASRAHSWRIRKSTSRAYSPPPK